MGRVIPSQATEHLEVYLLNLMLALGMELMQMVREREAMLAIYSLAWLYLVRQC